MGNKKVIVVDGANVAYIERSQKGAPKVSNLVKVRSALEQEGYSPIIIVDASLVHEIDDRPQLESLIDNQLVLQAPAGTDADFFVLKTAQDKNSMVVSNDRFEPYQEQFPWIKKRRLPLMIINGKVELYQPELNN